MCIMIVTNNFSELHKQSNAQISESTKTNILHFIVNSRTDPNQLGRFDWNLIVSWRNTE